ncbi:MAG: aldehyde dehydrogenase family protein [Deltaproteobacteria bacterium]|nr:aldehyde dehydrogenase family protein [Deltaproteobacteria bacterium]
MPDILSPIDGRVAYGYAELPFEAALAKIERAETVQRSWAQTPLPQRIALCQRMLESYRARLPEYSEQITRMMGKPVGQARGEFERSMCERVNHLCSIAEAALADDVLPEKAGLRRFIRREPVGVVLDIAAWNYPLLIAVNVVVPAVLAGNAVLLKHAHQTALVADQFEQAFLAAGAPAGLVQALPVDHATAAQLMGTRRFGYVAFTGSVRGGHEVYRAVAQDNFIGVGLELGGKDPALVLPDCDFDFTVDNLVDGAFYNSGQSCCGIERIYVHEDLHDRFVEAYVELTKKYVLGDPMRDGVGLGPMVNAAAAEHVRAQNRDAVTRGARALVADGHFAVPELSPCYLAPQVFDHVDHSMALMREETFGPSIGIMRIRDEAEGVRLMNDSHYGLTASIWTRDAERGAALATQVEAGTVFLNRCDYLDPAMAWTGVKDSGHGVSLSTLGFDQVTRPKNFHLRVSW